VRLSGRLTRSPAVLVVAEHDYSPQLERILSMGRGDGYRQRRILELNADHALVQGLRRRFDANPSDPVVGDYAELLLGWSLLAEGSEPHDPVRFTQLVAALMETGLDATPAAVSAGAPPTASAEADEAATVTAAEAAQGSDAPPAELSGGAPSDASGTGPTEGSGASAETTPERTPASAG
jgi:hypothetical protein